MEIYNNDIILLADLSFPGFFSSSFCFKKSNHLYAICHATSLNKNDFFEGVRSSKWLMERGAINIFNKVFVATDYHAKKLNCKNVSVTGLPLPPMIGFTKDKIRNIISVSRPNPQKVDPKIEKFVENNFYKIERPSVSSWNDYFRFISESKAMLISSHEETFGYQIVDAILNGCIPVAPNRCSYPELLPKEYLYNNTNELFQILQNIFKNKMSMPKLKNCEIVNNFYKNIVSEFKKGFENV